MNLRAILEQSMGPQYQAMFHAWELCASINMKKPLHQIIKELEEMLEEHKLLFKRSNKPQESFERGYERGYTSCLELVIEKIKNNEN